MPIIRHSLRETCSAGVLAVLALALAVALPSSPAAAGTPTPRAQFWQHVDFTGDKLDKDVENWEPATAPSEAHGYADVLDLGNVGRSWCYSWWSQDVWARQISSLTTTGGGQNPVHLVAYEQPSPDRNLGRCLYVPPGKTVPDLRNIPVIRPDGSPATADWNDRIESFEIAAGWSTAPDSFRSVTARCETYISS
jgi:hypothetical protein